MAVVDVFEYFDDFENGRMTATQSSIKFAVKPITHIRSPVSLRKQGNKKIFVRFSSSAHFN
jgi:hypothetical protein